MTELEMALTPCVHRTDVPCAACEMARRRGDLDLQPLPDDLELPDGSESLDGIDQSEPDEIPELDLGGEG